MQKEFLNQLVQNSSVLQDLNTIFIQKLEEVIVQTAKQRQIKKLPLL